jgi:hypothetical protein
MLNSLRVKNQESEFPFGSKRSHKIKLPPEGYVYGLAGKKDEEGAGTSKNKKRIKNFK